LVAIASFPNYEGLDNSVRADRLSEVGESVLLEYASRLQRIRIDLVNVDIQSGFGARRFNGC